MKIKVALLSFELVDCRLQAQTEDMIQRKELRMVNGDKTPGIRWRFPRPNASGCVRMESADTCGAERVVCA